MQRDYERLKAEWLGGDRDRENTLWLLFLAWMNWADPPFVTGMAEDPEARDLWLSIFDFFGGEDAEDAEFLHVAALMADLFPYVLGDERVWLECAQRMRSRSFVLKPDGFSPQAFEGRGDYGEYFAHQARSLIE